MSFTLTENAELASKEGSLTPNIVLEIDGIDTVFGSVTINKYLVYGEEFSYGENYVYGGLIPIADQKSYISFSAGTTTTIKQTLNIDRGTGESISSITVALLDKNEEITDMISPGNQVPELLGLKCRLKMGFESTAYPDDYITIFRGNINAIEAKPGVILLKILHPDNKKNSGLFIKAETKLNGDCNIGATVVTVDDTSDFFSKVAGPSGSYDGSILYYVKINDEVIQYDGLSGTQFTTITRGALGTTEANHSDNDTVESFIRLIDNPINLALKIMCSGKNGPYVSSHNIDNFVRLSATSLVSDTIFFKDVNIEDDINVIVGDYVTTTGASSGSNNVSSLAITSIDTTEDGSYLTVAGAGFVEEVDTAGVLAIRSQYDTLGEGLKMANDEIDLLEHININSRFTSTYNMDFYIKDTMDDIKTFISEQLYNPIGCFSLPRKARSSLGIHNPPLPGVNIKIFNDTNVRNASMIKIERSLTKNFFNAIVYKYDDLVLEDELINGLTTIDGDSKTRFGDNVGDKVLQIHSKGLRSDVDAAAVAATATARRLAKYKFGAESIRDMKLSFSDGFNLEVGDVLLLEMNNLKMSDIQSGTRSGAPRLWQIENKTVNLKNGDISIALSDTNFSKDARYGLISPASFVKSGSSGTQFVIEESFASTYGANEWKKWQDLIGVSVRVRSVDFATEGNSTIQSISGNTMTLTSDLGFTPSAGMLMEFDVYGTQPDSIKLIYAFMSDASNDFADSSPAYNQF